MNNSILLLTDNRLRKPVINSDILLIAARIAGVTLPQIRSILVAFLVVFYDIDQDMVGNRNDSY